MFHAIDRAWDQLRAISIPKRSAISGVLVSDMSGRTNILMKAKELGFKLAPDAPETREITARS